MIVADKKYRKVAAHPLAGARGVYGRGGRLAGYITRSYKAYTTTVTGWRFHPEAWTGLEPRVFSAALGEAYMLRQLEAIDV